MNAVPPLAIGHQSRMSVFLAVVQVQAVLSPGFRHAVQHLMDRPQIFRAAPDLDALTNVQIPRSDGGNLAAFAARPSHSDSGALPILLVIHEFFGLTDSVVAKAQAYADELGCLAIAPDTFRGTTTSFIPKAIWLALSTPQERVDSDLDDVVGWASDQPGIDATRVGVLGFCYGGGKALRYVAGTRPDAASVIFYGNPLTRAEDLAALRAPVCGVFGQLDPQIPPPLVDGFRRALAAAGVQHEVVAYEGVGHAFWSDVQQIEREEMPQLAAWRLTTNFLRTFFESAEGR